MSRLLVQLFLLVLLAFGLYVLFAEFPGGAPEVRW